MNGENALIISHLPPFNPPFNPCLCSWLSVDWSERFSVLLERYSSTIKGQMYAHVHQDYFALMRGSKKQPIGIGFVNPSLTTHMFSYPSFRIYDMHEQSYDLLDYTQYHLDLAKSNKELKAYWETAYKFSQYYEVPDMSFQTHELLVERMHVLIGMTID